MAATLLRKVAKTKSPPSLRSLFSAHNTIQAVPRECTGGRVAARERALGRIPTILQSLSEGSEDSRRELFTTDSKQINHLIKEKPYFFSTVFPLEVRPGPSSNVVLSSRLVLPIKVHRDKESGAVLNLLMVRAEKGTKLKVDVPLVFKGESACPGLKKGGYLHKIRSTLKYFCPAEHIPPKIEIDLSNLDIGDKVYIRDVEVHTLLRPIFNNDAKTVCEILSTAPVAASNAPSACRKAVPRSA